jgi:hypothetical protein
MLFLGLFRMRRAKKAVFLVQKQERDLKRAQKKRRNRAFLYQLGDVVRADREYPENQTPRLEASTIWP